MFSHVQEIVVSTAALVTTPHILAFAISALAGCLFFTFINVFCTTTKKRRKKNMKVRLHRFSPFIVLTKKKKRNRQFGK